ncbi:MAG: MarC family protein [Gammaproteobacteria bacterium]
MNWSEIASVAVTLFLIMDPLGNIPLFNAILSNVAPEKRAKVIVRELIVALMILIGALLAGNAVLSFLSLTQPALNIAGGILLFIISLKMIFPGTEPVNSEGISDPFIVPLAVPLIAGPSTIAVLLLLSSTQPEKLLDWTLALVLAWLGTTVLLVISPSVLKIIGARGARAMERLMGMILIIISTQMLLNGIEDFVHSL